ncbi:DNA-binding response regulator, partial [Clostridium perfringens]
KKNYDSEKAKKIYQEKLKSQGKLTEKDRIFQLREKIKSLKLEGLKNKEIALMLKVPIKTLERHITYMKKNGLL